MSFDEVLLQYETDLKNLDAQLRSSHQSLKASLVEDTTFMQHFKRCQHPARKDSSNIEYKALSLSQLNNKCSEIEQDLVLLSKIKQISVEVDEISSLLDKQPKSLSDLLDFQQLFSLFKSSQKHIGSLIASDASNPSPTIIFKQISKKLDSLYETFIVQLNQYAANILPDEFTIQNPAILGDFNSIITKNDIKLDHYVKLRGKWDKLVERILVNNHNQIQLNITKYELDDVVQLQESDSSNFLQSLHAFVTYMNHIGITTINQYLTSKIDRLLIERITAQIGEINNDESKIEDLKALLQLCHSTKWNILGQFDVSSNSAIKEHLNKLHVDWLVDSFVERIRDKILHEKIEPDQDWVPQESETLATEKIEEPKVDEPEPEEDAWNDSWDDGWDDDAELDAVLKATESPKKSKDKNEEHTFSTKGTACKISNLPTQLVPIYEEYRTISNDPSQLVTMTKALSLSRYPPLSRSFLLFNDFNYLHKKLQIESFFDVSKSLWNQALVQFHQELKVLVASLDLSPATESEVAQPDSDEDDDFFVLDDYNLNQVGLIYHWFSNIFQETELRATNAKKFEELIITLVEFVNNWLINSIIHLPEIAEYQSKKISEIVESLNNVTIPFLIQIEEPKDNIKSYSKLNNVRFLISNHLADIMDRFYQGDLFDISTEELVSLIKHVFVKSELRDGYINEIVEFRTMN